jgi:hypothetical protein
MEIMLMIVSKIIPLFFYLGLAISGRRGFIFGLKLQDQALWVALSFFIVGHLMFNFFSETYWIFIVISGGIYIFSLGMLIVANCKHKRFKPQTSQFSNHINCK